MKLYFDTCCYGRPFDNQEHQEQENVKQEVIAINNTIKQCKASGYTIYGSPALIAEMGRIRNDEKRKLVHDFYVNTVDKEITSTASILKRAEALIGYKLRVIDAHHTAFAEAAGADYLLTTDGRFERAASKLRLAVIVLNPVTFIQGGYVL